MSYQVQHPILLLAFNRPDTASQVLAKVRAMKPAKLYVAVDGAREHVATDAALVAATRQLYAQLDWDCDIHRLYSDVNKGCKLAVAGAITWFFEHEEAGIILEDDCLPADDFFPFCDEMLTRYRDDERMMNITGTNLQQGRVWGEGSYYFSQYSHIWGWASWRRAWQHYRVDLEGYEAPEAIRQLQHIFTDAMLVQSWEEIFHNLKAGKINSWDYQFNMITFFRNGLCITPNVNLISNIGFREDATHTFNVPQQHAAALATGGLDKPLRHPQYFVPEKEADYFFLEKDFWLQGKWQHYHQVQKDKLLRRRVKKWIRGLFRKK